MIGLDIFMNSLSSDEYSKTKQHLNNIKNDRLPLVSSDFFFQYLNTLPKEDAIKLLNLSDYYNWQNNINSILKENIFESIVVTDVSKKIIWVNDGFSKMTGYSKKFAINKTPAFLQGKDTLQTTKKTIRKRLNNKEPFKEIILNYKKDNSSYKCELHIFPLYNNKNEVTHYLALEKQVA